MSTKYPGLPTVARRFWHTFGIAILAGTSLLVFTGALAAVIVLLLLPDAVGYLLIASVSYVLHNSAFFTKDVISGEYEPSQTSVSTAKEALAVTIVMGSYISAILLIATGGAILTGTIVGEAAVFAAVVAAYYPVLDVVLLRREGWISPGGIAILASITLINTVIDIHESTVDILPVIGKRRRLQR